MSTRGHDSGNNLGADAGNGPALISSWELALARKNQGSIWDMVEPKGIA